MDIQTARQILKISENATFDVIKKRYRLLAKKYHPDIPNLGNREMFLIISTAFTTLKNFHNSPNESVQQALPGEVIHAIGTKVRCKKRFSKIKNDYDTYHNKKLKSSLEIINNLIYSAKSTPELREILENQVTHRILTNINDLEKFVKDLIHYESKKEEDFLFDVFKDFYQLQKNYFLENIFSIILKYPVVKFTLISVLLSSTTFLLFGWWIIIKLEFFLLINGTLIYLFDQYFSLSYISLNYSPFTFQTVMEKNIKSIPLSSEELNAAGWISGSLFSLAFLPLGIIGLVPIAINALIGYDSNRKFTKKFSVIQENLINEISKELQLKFDEIHQQVMIWIDRCEEELIQKSEQNFANNLERVDNFVLDLDFTKYLSSKEIKRLPESFRN